MASKLRLLGSCSNLLAHGSKVSAYERASFGRASSKYMFSRDVSGRLDPLALSIISGVIKGKSARCLEGTVVSEMRIPEDSTSNCGASAGEGLS